MSGADVLGYALALAVACVAIALVVNGIRNALYSIAFVRLGRYRARLAKVETDLAQHGARLDEFHRTLIAVQVARMEDVAHIHDRIDVLAKQYMKLRAATLTTEEIDHATDLLVADLQKLTEPGAPTPGPDDLHTPPEDERKA